MNRWKPRRYNVSFSIGERWGKQSRYTLMEICKCVLEAYSIREKELEAIIQLAPAETFFNEDVRITRLS